MNTGRDVWLMLKGMAMGVAEVIPGVSGGTIAFITGIYEQLINSIKAFHPNLISMGLNQGLRKVWERIDGRFLILLLTGMAFGLVIGVFGISHLIETDPEILWGFFFGLIIASAIYVARIIPKWEFTEWVMLILGFGVATAISFLSPAEGSTHWLMIYFSGFIAISAMLLPGVSGSFILLLLGMYSFIIPSLKSFLSAPNTGDGWIIFVFALGCLTGLASFSRFLSWTFTHYKNPTLATLTGFMAGSLFKIWPWRNPEIWIIKSTGEMITEAERLSKTEITIEQLRLIKEHLVGPGSYHSDPQSMFVSMAMIVGFSVVYFLGIRQPKRHYF